MDEFRQGSPWYLECLSASGIGLTDSEDAIAFRPGLTEKQHWPEMRWLSVMGDRKLIRTD